MNEKSEFRYSTTSSGRRLSENVVKTSFFHRIVPSLSWKTRSPSLPPGRTRLTGLVQLVASAQNLAQFKCGSVSGIDPDRSPTIVADRFRLHLRTPERYLAAPGRSLVQEALHVRVPLVRRPFGRLD